MEKDHQKKPLKKDKDKNSKENNIDKNSLKIPPFYNKLSNNIRLKIIKLICPSYSKKTSKKLLITDFT